MLCLLHVARTVGAARLITVLAGHTVTVMGCRVLIHASPNSTWLRLPSAAGMQPTSDLLCWTQPLPDIDSLSEGSCYT